jgi:hypothetical protein
LGHEEGKKPMKKTKNAPGKDKKPSVKHKKEKGMISFIYRLIWDPETQDAFIQSGKRGRDNLFTAYGLTKDDRAAIVSNDSESIFKSIEDELKDLLQGVSQEK